MFDKTQIAALSLKLNAVLQEFADENGLVAGHARIRYGSTDFKAEVTFSDEASNPNSVDPRFLIDLARRGYMHGLSKEMVGKTTVLPSRQGLVKYEFLGMRASKAVFKSTVDSKNYLFNAEVAAKYLKA